MPSVAVIVPWQPGCPHREAAWRWVRRQYRRAHPDWDILPAPAPPGPWCKAAAVLPSAYAVDHDLVVVADADVWCDELAGTVQDVVAGAPWAMPHRVVRRLSEPATGAVLDGAALDKALPLAERAYRGVDGGGLVVLPRRTLLEIPLDLRFHGWGQEDLSWALALQTLAGDLTRRTGTLFHLWHPPQERATRKVGSVAGQQLHRRYLRASGHPDQMRALLAEASR